ncbi:uncharacterized protein K452DRAFT_304664 [Aplosporella prunicola CBS 121167]|uniref:Uncharacterized protein n=1 Tax=Aplosporella prunicola CBS 121167 TaxID=1176127 RepID=A0A6A6BU32_9PEZI|nr:uncharacterized protein K452DRAFT_304664 [Aplosporella prunicola CBS 121167]KAF2146724.1 hypothetical protein K452DRAFT_304664 [Aplosporella prunicola CBS 121167]
MYVYSHARPSAPLPAAYPFTHNSERQTSERASERGDYRVDTPAADPMDGQCVHLRAPGGPRRAWPGPATYIGRYAEPEQQQGGVANGDAAGWGKMAQRRRRRRRRKYGWREGGMGVAAAGRARYCLTDSRVLAAAGETVVDGGGGGDVGADRAVIMEG